jgi:hypothetical protein
MFRRSLTVAVVSLLALAAGAFAADTAAYIYGLVGVFAGDYDSGDSKIYEKLVGYYPYPGYGIPAGAGDWQKVELSSTDFAASPFGFGLKGDTWRASFVGLWNRHKIDSMTETRQVNNGSLTATGGYIFNRGYFEDKMLKPYAGGFWRGNWTKAENVENGIIANGFGPDVGMVMEFDLNRSFALVTFGYQYKAYVLTGTKYDDPTGGGTYDPQAPHWNYGYIPENAVPGSGSSLYVSAKSSLQFHRRVGAEVEVRYDLDLGDSFMNGLTFAVGPSLWL